LKGQAKRTTTRAPATTRRKGDRTRTATQRKRTRDATGKGGSTSRVTSAAARNNSHEPWYLPDPPRIERRKSRVHGWGVFALEGISKNKRIIHYAGEKIPSRVSTPREEHYLAKGHIWCFKLNNRWVIDAAVGGNVARFINHACRPNCYADIRNGVIWIRAARSIRAGEELTYNYYTEGHAEIPCRCRPGCQGML
jgi:hypothetical protein